MKFSNQEIWLAYPKLVELSTMRLPAKTALGVAWIMLKLQEPYTTIERQRTVLVNRYGALSLDKKQVSVEPDAPNAGDFALAFGELLIQEWGKDIEFEKVKIPEKLSCICEICGHETEIVFLIDPQILLPLLGMVEI